MSENQNRRTADFAKYDTMATEELEEILRLDSQALEGQGLDGEELLYVMEVLARRKHNNDSPGKTAQQAWESFEKHYLPSEEDTNTEQNNESLIKARPRFRRWIAVAAVVAILVAIPFTAGALSWEEICNTVARWAKNTFSFSSVENTTPTEPAEEDFNEYASLQTAMKECGDDFNGLPTWIPEGYKLDEIRVTENPMQKNYMAQFKNGEKAFRINIRSYLMEDPEKIEINEDLLEAYKVSNVEYYIFSNNKRNRAVWIKDTYECNISGDLTVDEIKLMIDSIVKG